MHSPRYASVLWNGVTTLTRGGVAAFVRMRWPRAYAYRLNTGFTGRPSRNLSTPSESAWA
jgi:hypothetical protein